MECFYCAILEYGLVSFLYFMPLINCKSRLSSLILCKENSGILHIYPLLNLCLNLLLLLLFKEQQILWPDDRPLLSFRIWTSVVLSQDAEINVDVSLDDLMQAAFKQQWRVRKARVRDQIIWCPSFFWNYAQLFAFSFVSSEKNPNITRVALTFVFFRYLTIFIQNILYQILQNKICVSNKHFSKLNWYI